MGLILPGDSHADAIVNAVAEALPAGTGGGVLFLGSGCVSVPGALTLSMDETCSLYFQKQMARLHSGWPQVPIIIANRWTYYLMGANEDDPAHKGQLIRFAGEATIQSQPEFLNEFRRSFLAGVCELSQRRTVYLMSPIPEMGLNVPDQVIENIREGHIPLDVSISLESHRERHTFVDQLMREARDQCGARIIDPATVLCDGEICHGSIQSRPLYFDDDHLNEYGNRLLVPIFEKALQRPK